MKNQKTPQPVTTERLNASLRGEIQLPGDKSISHRSFILSALAVGTSKIQGLLEGEDVLATGKAMQAMGAQTVRQADGTWEVTGRGVSGLTSPDEALDFGNSGTGIRLTLGAMTGCPVTAKCVGDESLSRRPMGRVTEPLEQMGAVFEFHGVARGQLPLTLTSPQRALPIDYVLPVASAQVKSCILLAGLGAPGITAVTEKQSTRDHTERMLSLMGVNLVRLGNSVTVEPKSRLQNIDYYVPGDPSSAAFLIAIGVLKIKELNIKNVLLNERRIGFLKILKKMNADITIKDVEVKSNENIGTIVVKKSRLQGVIVEAKDVADMVDEFPVFTLLASQATGNTVVEGAQELRLKESDRIMAMENFIINLGGQINTNSNGYKISGIQELQGGIIKTEEDHRIAMTGVVANI